TTERGDRGDNFHSMKRQELEKKLRKAGCYLKREGASHSLWINPQTGVIEAVPRHTEIKEFLAQKILRNLNAQ
ncbi:MAG: type II toxin-antitoxin system HicA family toxin, partial [Microcystis sp. LE19-12.2C]|nr:type II toxin-antitoxin system HicA family toxin [Microcystis sp. LE19-12.2C]